MTHIQNLLNADSRLEQHQAAGSRIRPEAAANRQGELFIGVSDQQSGHDGKL